MELENSKKFYSMELNERMCIIENEKIYVLRVAGGWIYEFQKPAANILKLVFVPFSNEFMI